MLFRDPAARVSDGHMLFAVPPGLWVYPSWGQRSKVFLRPSRQQMKDDKYFWLRCFSEPNNPLDSCYRRHRPCDSSGWTTPATGSLRTTRWSNHCTCYLSMKWLGDHSSHLWESSRTRNSRKGAWKWHMSNLSFDLSATLVNWCKINEENLMKVGKHGKLAPSAFEISCWSCCNKKRLFFLSTYPLSWTVFCRCLLWCFSLFVRPELGFHALNRNSSFRDEFGYVFLWEHRTLPGTLYKCHFGWFCSPW